VPKALDADLLASCGLSLAEDTVLVHLSEAPGRSMRMNELAAESILTASGLTWVVERNCARSAAARGETTAFPRQRRSAAASAAE
jgi:hypothetical protein